MIGSRSGKICLATNLDIKQIAKFTKITSQLEPISGRGDRAFAINTVDSGSISGQVKPKTTKTDIHSFLS